MEEKVVEGYMKAMKSMAIESAMVSFNDAELSLERALRELKAFRQRFEQAVYQPEANKEAVSVSGSDVMLWAMNMLQQIDVKAVNMAQAAIKLSEYRM